MNGVSKLAAAASKAASEAVKAEAPATKKEIKQKCTKVLEQSREDYLSEKKRNK